MEVLGEAQRAPGHPKHSLPEGKKCDTANGNLSARDIRADRRNKFREKQAAIADKATGSVMDPHHPNKVSDSFDNHNAQNGNVPNNKSQSNSQAFQQELHHSDDSGVSPHHQPSSQSDGLEAEKILLHASRKSNVSDFEQEKLPKLKLPPSSNSAVWNSINEELAIAIPLVFPQSKIDSLTSSELAQKVDKWLYNFFLDKFKEENKAPDPNLKSTPHEPRPRRVHTGLESLRSQKQKCKAARKALIKAGFLGSPEEAAISLRWRRLIREHNRLRVALKKRKNGMDAAAAERQFKADPHKFASSLFESQAKNGIPTFDEKDAQDYFAKTYRDEDRNHCYSHLDGMERPTLPTCLFSLRCPSKKELRRCIRKKRNGATPGFNGLSYVPYKKCSAIIDLVHKIVQKIWKSKIVPDSWAQAFIVLLSKSDDLSKVSEFRPIAITSTIGKIFFSVVSDRLQKFMVKNNYIPMSTQKGFLAGMPGCLEHAFMLSEALRNAKEHQRQIVVTWIDLANAYGSVRHNLIQFALHWYHVPGLIRELIMDYYDKLMAKVISKKWSTGFFLFDIGLFQGCVLSTILFDCVFQLLLDFLKPLDEKLGYTFKGLPLCSMRKAYADDLALITKSPESNQVICDRTVFFLEWTGTMKAKPRKCISFGLRQFDPRAKNPRLPFVRYSQTKYSAFDPLIKIDGKLINFIVDRSKKTEFLQEHFKFLGKWIHVLLREDKIKEYILKRFMEDVELLENSKINGFMKLWIYQFYILARLSWPFLVQDFCLSFAENLEKSMRAKLKRWAGIYKSADVGILFRSRKDFGLGLTSISMHFKRMQFIKCSLLEHSPDNDVRQMYSHLEAKHASMTRVWKATNAFRPVENEVDLDLKFPGQTGCRQTGRQGLGSGNFNSNPSKTEKRKLVISNLFRHEQEKALSHTHGLSLHSVWIKWADSTIPFDLSWKNLIYGPGPYLLKFVLNSIINCVQTPDMLRLWNYVGSATCPLCLKPQCTLHHILANCSWALNGSRYNWRHDSILANMEPVLRLHISKMNDTHIKKLPHIMSSFVKAGTKAKVRTNRVRPSLLDGASDWKLQIDYEHIRAPFPADIYATPERPDIVIYSILLKKVFLIELTCPAEEGIEAAQLRKEGRYAPLVSSINQSKNWTAILMTIEVGARGFVALSMSRFLRSIGLPNREVDKLLKTLSLIAARCSYDIYLHRSNKNWDSRRPLLFV